MNIKKQQGTTLLQRACANVKGFNALHKRLEKKVIISGNSMSTLSNYMRFIAHVPLKYNCLPTELDLEQIEDYLVYLKKKGASEADFKKLPVVLSAKEMKELLKAPTLLKHRVLIGVLYGCGLRCHEVRSLLIKDMDFDRNMIHIRQGKGRKDRYVPLGEHLTRGLEKYLVAEKPIKWLFNGKDHQQTFSPRGTQWVIREASKRPISKNRSQFIHYAIPMLPICWSRGWILFPLKSCWVMLTSTPRWCICT